MTDGEDRADARGWQPIETAPKDGSSVMLAREDDDFSWVCEGHWDRAGLHSGWYAANTHWTDATGDALDPTHWQPLPAPPRPAEGGPSPHKEGE